MPQRPDAVEPVIRRATMDDAGAIAEIHMASFRATYDFPAAHTDEEVRGWVRDFVLPSTETWVAEADGVPVGFISMRDGWVEQLYVRPPRTGRGIGSRLLVLAKKRHGGGLQLWTFQVNRGARRFYEHHGFRAVEQTDGAANEERQPDVRYVWP